MTYELNGRGRCPHCLQPTRFEAAAASVNGAEGYTGFQDSSEIEIVRRKDPVNELGFTLWPVACAVCGGVVVVAAEEANSYDESRSSWVALPRRTSRPVPSEVRESSPHIASDFEEAAAVLPLSPKASAALSRRCLQAVLAERGGALQSNLSNQIDAVRSTLPSTLADDVDAIRIVGNFAAHPMKEQASGLILDVEPEEAEWTLEVLEELFEFYFVQPARSAARRDKLNGKLERAGKGPMKQSS